MFTPETPPVLILGAHRSGTSMITERLAALGLFVGVRLDGHAESAFFQRLNRRLTSEAGGHWTTPRIVIDALADIDDLATFAEPLRAHLNGPSAIEYWGLHRGARSGAWGWKDPRNTYLVPVWTALFPDLRIISIQRDPRACALSLHQRTTELRSLIANEADAARGRRPFPGHLRAVRGRPILADGWRTTTLAGALDVALDYRELQVGLHERHPHVLVIDYEQFVADPARELTAATRFCGLSPSSQLIHDLAASVLSSNNSARVHGVDLTADQRRRLETLGYGFETVT